MQNKYTKVRWRGKRVKYDFKKAKATPTLKIIYKDGDSKMITCLDDGPTDPASRPLWI